MMYGLIGPRDLNGKEYDNYRCVAEVLDTFEFGAIVSGGSKGIERLAEKYCRENNIPCTIIQPNFSIKPVSVSFMMRNTDIVAKAEELIIFWDGEMESIPTILVHTTKTAKKVAHVFPML